MKTSLESVLLLKDVRILQHLQAENSDWEKDLVQKFLQGKHLEVVTTFDSTSLDYQKLIKENAETSSTSIFEAIREAGVAYLTNQDSSLTLQNKMFGLFMLGLTYLELYCQCNYTGPELSNVLRMKYELSTNKNVIDELECDGYYPYHSVDMPQFLLAARSILSLLATPYQKHWKNGIHLDEDGNILIPSFTKEEVPAEQQDIFGLLEKEFHSLSWWHARAITFHARLLQKQNYDAIPRLWTEVASSSKAALVYYGGASTTSDLLKSDVTELCLASTLTRLFPTSEQAHSLRMEQLQRYAMMLQGSIWLEWGLICNHFLYGDRGKKAFQVAKESIRLETTLTAALGKRTKYQREDIAQLYLYAKSSIIDLNDIVLEEKKTESSGRTLLPKASPPVAVTNPEETSGAETAANGDQEGSAATGEEWQHGEWELGKRLVSEVEGGEEAAVREVLLDSMDGGAAENIILEGGPHFQRPNEVDTGGHLHPIDQALILALCLDVNNSNPVDGLTNAEMTPYIERTLNQANNWMIHSTALLERSWIEFERRKTMDRAMLQIQALIDQHSTKLTIMQSSYRSVEDSAPVQDRLLYLYQLVYPSQFELKRDLAMKYLRCQVFMSALNYFKELEMWDEVVTCYQLLQKPQRAEIVVREQLKISETPYMVTSLADLTGKEELYEKAWEISKGRFPRAKRTLGKICYDRGDFEKAFDHLTLALKVQPLVHTAWYLRGICCMRLERWEEGVKSFVRCIQQDEEVGEAWANMGAIHMHLKDYAKANHCLSEALKQKHNDWRILENLLSATIGLKKWKDAIRYLSLLVDQRHQSQRPLNIRELRYLTRIAVTTCKVSHKELTKLDDDDEDTTEGENAALVAPAPEPTIDNLQSYPSEEVDTIATVTDVALALEKLFDKITTSLKSEPDVWDVVAEYNFHLGKYKTTLDARIKQFRAIINEASWEKSAEKVESLSKAADLVIEALQYKEVKKEDLYSCRMLLQSTARKFDRNLSFSQQHIDAFAKKVLEIDAISNTVHPRVNVVSKQHGAVMCLIHEDLETGQIFQQIHDLRKSVDEILERNKIKDLGKGFETSNTRVIVIMALTYCTLFLYMKFVLQVGSPALNAIVPTVGFNLSTWSLYYIKPLWIKYKDKNIFSCSRSVT